jgi:hypothetical protein
MSYKNLEAACWDLCVKLYNLDHLDLVLKGYFPRTYFLEYPFNKRYTVTLLFPYTEFEIKKMTKGDIDQEEFMKTLNKVYEIFNERIQHKD